MMIDLKQYKCNVPFDNLYGATLQNIKSVQRCCKKIRDTGCVTTILQLGAFGISGYRVPNQIVVPKRTQ